MTKTPRWLFALLTIPLFFSESLGEVILMISSGFRTALKNPDLHGTTASMTNLAFPGPVAIILGTMVEVAVMMLGIWLLYHWGYIAKKKIKWQVFLLTLLIGFVAIYAIESVGGIIMQWQDKNISSNQQALVDMMALIPGYFMFIMTVFTAPILEELIFRGMIQQGVFRNSWLGYLVSSLLFGLAHTPDSLGAAFVYIGMGAVLGFLAFKFKRLEYSIGLHMLNNFVAVLGMYHILGL